LDVVTPGCRASNYGRAIACETFEVPIGRAAWFLAGILTPRNESFCVYAPLHARVGGGVCKTFFNIFVDPKFTAFLTPLFTKLFDRGFPRNLAACVSYACNAD
jgi:hypothetical protein